MEACQHYRLGQGWHSPVEIVATFMWVRFDGGCSLLNAFTVFEKFFAVSGSCYSSPRSEVPNEDLSLFSSSLLSVCLAASIDWSHGRQGHEEEN